MRSPASVRRVGLVLLGVAATAVVLVPLAGRAAEEGHGHGAVDGHAMMQHERAGFDDVKQLVAVLHPTRGNDVHGIARFIPAGEGKVKVLAQVSGLEPGAKHGFHIHEFGDCSAADGTSAGGHYNPQGVAHALPSEHSRHAGDLGNLEADAQGVARLELVVDNFTLAGPTHPIIGRGVIVHAKTDDGGQPTGNAGARIACGVIGVAKGD